MRKLFVIFGTIWFAFWFIVFVTDSPISKITPVKEKSGYYSNQHGSYSKKLDENSIIAFVAIPTLACFIIGGLFPKKRNQSLGRKSVQESESNGSRSKGGGIISGILVGVISGLIVSMLTKEVSFGAIAGLFIALLIGS